MNRTALSLTFSLCVLTGLLSCQPASPDANRDAMKAANASPTKEPLNPVAIEAEIIKLEKEWTAAEQRHDVEGVRRILADDLVMTYQDGTTGTKTSELTVVEAGSLTADAWELADLKVTILNADSAFITGRSVIKNGKYKDPVSKKVGNISGEYRFTDVYLRRNGQWQAVASQTTQIQNPVVEPSPAASPTATETSSPK